MWVIMEEPSKNLTLILDGIGMSGNVYAKKYLPKRPGPRPRSDRFVSCSRHVFSRRFVYLCLSHSILGSLFLGANNEARCCLIFLVASVYLCVGLPH